jgi:hypothetical protein
MISIAFASLANLVGLAIAAVALILLGRGDRDWRAVARSRRGLGLLSLCAGGVLLAAGGQLLLCRLSYGPASRAEARAQVQAALMEPLEALTLRVNGPDPFRGRSGPCSLRLTAVTKAGRRLVSDIPRGRMALPWTLDAGAKPAPGGAREYVIFWQAVVDGAAGDEAREVLSRVRQINDLRYFDHVEVAVVGRDPGRAPVPDSIRVESRSETPVVLVDGHKATEEAEQEGGDRVSASYRDPPWFPLPDRLAGWDAVMAYGSQRRNLDVASLGFAAAGGSLVAVGVGLLALGRIRRAAEGWRAPVDAPPARPPAPPPGPRADRADVAGGPGDRPAPSRAPSWAAPSFVWGAWAAMLAAGLVFVARYSHNIPFGDDWAQLLPYGTGAEPITCGAMWAQDCEHRYPLTRAVALSLIRLSGCDFRAPTVFRVVALGGLAAAMILVAGRARGRARFTDAFFPLLLLPAAFPAPLVKGWEHLAYIVPTIVAAPLLMVAARRGTRLTPGTAMLAGACMALLPLCSAAGLLYLPLIMAWLGLSAALLWRSPEPRARRTSLVIACWIAAAIACVLLYFRGYNRAAANFYSPASPGVRATAEASLAVVASTLGEASILSWPASGLAMLVLLALTTANLAREAWRGDDPGRDRALGLMFFLGASGMLALGLGWGRAGLGFELGFRYTLLAIPILCCVYFAWDLPRSGRAGRLARACLLAAAGLAAWVDIPRRIRAAEQEHASGLAFERDIRRGMPPHRLIAQHGGRLGLWSLDGGNYWLSGGKNMSILRDAKVGPFRFLKDDPAFRAVPLPLAAVEEKGVELEEGMAHGTNGESYLTFALPGPMYVAAVRVRCGAPQAGAASFCVAWRRGGERDFPEPQYFYPGWPDRPITIPVADTIDRIRIYPDRNPVGFRPFDFHISKLEILVPAVEGELADGTEAGMPVPLRPPPTPGRPEAFDR